MFDLKPYGTYTEISDWVRALPTHWQWLPARALFHERKCTGNVDEPLLSVTIGRGVITQRALLASTSKKDSSNEDKSKYKLVLPGDLVYNKMRAWQGAAGLSAYRGIVSPAYIVMTPRTGDVGFYHHIVRSPMFAREAERWSYGISSDQWSLRPEHFKMTRFPIPSAPEQVAIVSYLAQADARIDEAIAAKRALIGLFKEQSIAQTEALLEEAAQRCAEPMLARSLLSIEQGTSPSPAEGELADDQWAVLSLSSINRGEFVPSAIKPIDPSFAMPESMQVHNGDLLMTRSNTRERVGDVAIVQDARHLTIMPDLIYRLRLREDRITPNYARLALLSRRARNQIEVAARGSSGTMPKLAQGHIRALRVPLPELSEQVDLVCRASAANAPLAVAIDRTTREIALLTEFRTRLTADVVTGQVDVRAIAKTLPGVYQRADWVQKHTHSAEDAANSDELIEASEG